MRASPVACVESSRQPSVDNWASGLLLVAPNMPTFVAFPVVVTCVDDSGRVGIANIGFGVGFGAGIELLLL